MKIIKKILKWFFIVVASLVILGVIADLAWIYVPQMKAQSEIKGLSEVAQPIDAISVPPQTAVIALGEASHGNVEFQEIKRSVLQQVVERQGVRAFALEADFGEGVLINRYIHGMGGATTADEAVASLSFNIYHTQQMIDLVQWMHDYNITATQDQRLFFCGFDLQNPRTELKLLLQLCEENQVLPGFSKDPIQNYLDGNYAIVGEQAKDVFQCIDKIEEEIANNQNKGIQYQEDALFMQQIIRCVRNFATCLDDGGAANYIRYNNMRDEYMAENVLWILEYVKNQGSESIMISGHNDHVAFRQKFCTPMGSHLKDALGNQYFVIGTDYYKTNCNINEAGSDATRGDHKFCSADIFAANAGKIGGSYYLDFSNALAQNGKAWELLNTHINMGSLGEGYTWLMNFLPTSHRLNAKPADLYNAMIFFYETTPIQVL